MVVKTKELALKQILSVPCPTCGAPTEEPCDLHTGALRTELHRDRKLSAAEAVEGSQSKRQQPVRPRGAFGQADLIPPMNGYCGNWVRNTRKGHSCFRIAVVHPLHQLACLIAQLFAFLASGVLGANMGCKLLVALQPDAPHHFSKGIAGRA